MRTPSIRALSALAYDRGGEYDPAELVTPELLELMALADQARPVIGDDGPYEKRRQTQRERRRRNGSNGIPEWFSAEDLIAAPWEPTEQRFA